MNSQTVHNNSNEVTLRDLILKGKAIVQYLKGKIIGISFFGLLGGIVGVMFAIITPTKYISKITFVVEESKSGSGLSALAGQFGLDFGGGSGGSIFAGDNILLFLKSESLCREALLTPYDSVGSLTLADHYADVKKFKKAWRENHEIGEINFSKYKFGSLPRKEDSLLQIIIQKHILLSDLSITRLDKKTSFVQVLVSSVDEKFSALFSQRLVKIASSKYVESKTKLKSQNVDILQKRADSLAALLNAKTYNFASTQQVLIDINPALKSAPIKAEISAREKNMIGTIFAEVVKNLEISKSILSQETPAIQIVDQSTFPLGKVKSSKLKGFVTWGFMFAFAYITFLLFSKWIRYQI